MSIQEQKEMNQMLERLREIERLPNNWNNNGTESFSHNLIVKCISLWHDLQHPMEIFPVANGSIQFETPSNKDGEYLHFNVFEDRISLFFDRLLRG